MPRTILTDAAIEKKCPEYQPLGNPNAYFDNVGGFLKSEGIKSTPIRPPPRPARIQYLSANANLELEKVRQAVDTSVELAQPVAVRVAETVTATAPPFEASMLAGTPPTYIDALRMGVPPPTYQEGVAIGIPPPIYEEVLEEKDPIPMVQPRAVGRITVEGEPSFAPEPSFITEAQETIREIEELLESVETPTKHIVDHTTPIDEGVDIKRVQAERMSMLGEESLSRMRQSQEAEQRIQALEETLRIAEQLPAEAQTKAIQELERIQALREAREGERIAEQREISLAEGRSIAEQLTKEATQQALIGVGRAEQQRREASIIEQAEQQIASVTQQRVQAKQRAEEQLTQGILKRGAERVAKQRLEVASAVQNVGVSGLQQPPREEYEKYLAMRKEKQQERKKSKELRGFQEEAVRREKQKEAKKKFAKEIFIAPARTERFAGEAIAMEEMGKKEEVAPQKETARRKQRLRGAERAKAMETGLYNPFRTEL